MTPVGEAANGPMSGRAGIGLRFPHHRVIVDERPDVGWLEVHAENYFGGGTPLAWLDAIRRDYPIALHGVGASLGSVDAVDDRHLERLQRLIERVEPIFVSEHLAWSAVDGIYLADLLPLPMTDEALAVVCRNIERVQARLRTRILVENPSTYLRFVDSTIPEAQFLSELVAKTGCALLCDVNNAYVSALNHRLDADAWLAGLPASSVSEIHLAGHAIRHVEGSELRIDDHGSPVADEVWQLYAQALERFGPVPTLVEWDTRVPPLETLVAQAERADVALAAARRDRNARAA
ncbi:MAG TPA: DUF692 domain-containing protein [Casimicrobiaceae bacterium]|jgi:uncharacterized protein (UPF0276 family)|nr:DUF692 domain-containing protein [Casimicrobiaceae bacterium]